MNAKVRDDEWRLAKLLVSIIVTIATLPAINEFTTADFRAVSGVFATVSGVLLGFVVTALTVLSSIGDVKLIRNIKLTGYYKKIVNSLNTTMIFLILSCISALLLLFIPSQFSTLAFKSISLSSIIAMAAVFITVMAFCNFVLVWKRFVNLIQNIT